MERKRAWGLSRVVVGIGLLLGCGLTVHRAHAGVNEWSSNGSGAGLISALAGHLSFYER
ncbi:MAG: hypothetical protein HYZ50_27145 [Deltaproteobacteria bacterium]|nr:hypothetical protein [Deltaproteobacteria bacterium]